MRKVIIIAIFFQFIVQINSQTKISMINAAYSNLDSLNYINQLKNALKVHVYNHYNDSMNHIVENNYKNLKAGITNKKIIFVLNFEIDTMKINTNDFLL